MTPTELKSVFETALRDGQSFPWLVHIVLLILMLLASFLTAYVTQRGANRAVNENFKKLLAQQKEMTRETEAIKDSIARLSGEHGVRFAHLHAKVFDSTAMLYALLCRAHRCLNGYIRARMRNDREQLAITADALNELNHFFYEHEIYFSDDIVRSMESLLQEMKETFEILWGSEGAKDSDSIIGAVDSAIRKMMNDIEPIRITLKVSFTRQISLAAREDQTKVSNPSTT